jgi:hypothetical protein
MFKFAIKGGEDIFESDEGAMKVRCGQLRLSSVQCPWMRTRTHPLSLAQSTFCVRLRHSLTHSFSARLQATT